MISILCWPGHASWFGPGVGVDMFAVVTIGVGVGYSLAVNGKRSTVPG